MRIFFAFLFLIWMLPPLQASEGMWLPTLLGLLNEAEMQSMGMEISAEDIYSINQSSLKDAVVNFDNKCTGSIISAQGLLLTNFHCGPRAMIRTLDEAGPSGFWAEDMGAERPMPGVTATFIIRMDDVTESIKKGIVPNWTASQRQTWIAQRSNALIAAATKGTHYKAQVKEMAGGAAYYLILQEEFMDVRLVGAPPKSLGKFGGETDNWVWPRHNADFALFRIYTDSDGMPAPYAGTNIPYQAKRVLEINPEGIKEGDFTFVMGFPGTTHSFLSASGVELIKDVRDPVLTTLRGMRTEIYGQANPEKAQRYDRLIEQMANGYKKYQGRLEGFEKAPVIAYKRQQDQTFQQLILERRDWTSQFGHILPGLDSLYDLYSKLELRSRLFNEGGNVIEIVPFAYKFADLFEVFEDERADEESRALAVDRIKEVARKFYDGYDPSIDATVLASILGVYLESLERIEQPIICHIISDQFEGNAAAYAEYVFQYSSLIDSSRLWPFLDDFSPRALQQDPAYLLMASLYQDYFEYNSQYEKLEGEIDLLEGAYTQAQREVFPNRRFYPDANFTLRVSYGKVKSMQARDGVHYLPQTYLSGLWQKWESRKAAYSMEPGLVEVLKSAETEPYSTERGLPLAFIATNHTTGGNSGAPVFNGNGQLIGLNFDRNYEGTLSDVYYDPTQSRNISLDLRYILFVVDQVGKSKRLMEEIKLPEPAKGDG